MNYTREEIERWRDSEDTPGSVEDLCRQLLAAMDTIQAVREYAQRHALSKVLDILDSGPGR